MFRKSRGLIRLNWRAFLLVNVAYFGCVGCGMAYGSVNAASSAVLQRDIRREALASLPAVADAYSSGRFAAAVAMTLGINLVGGALLCVTAPSCLIPLSGLFVALLRAALWGLVFTPNFGDFGPAALGHVAIRWLLLLLEGEGYVLAAFGAYLHGAGVLFPARVGATSRWVGYNRGIVISLQMYPLVAATLAIAAVYEAAIVIYLIPALG